MPDVKKLHKILDSFGNHSVLVVGDLMWDEYIRGEVSRISPEAPVPVLLAKKDERIPGGAANVLKNLRDLGVQTGVIGIAGADENGMALVHEFERWKLKGTHILESADRPTTIKTRLMARNQQLLRVDREKSGPLPESLQDRLLEMFTRNAGGYDAVILSDYDKGIFTPRIISGIIEFCKNKSIYTAVDPQVRHFRQYTGCDIMTPNEKEASEGMGLPFPETDEDVKNIAEKIMSELDLRHLLITRSHKGMALYEKDSDAYLIPTLAREVFDVTGAGDTVISVLTAAIAAGANHKEASHLANVAGGIVVGKLGTATTSVNEMKSALQQK